MKASKGVDDGQPVPSGAEEGSIARAAGVLGGLTLLSRIAGLARDVVIGALFGASPAADAFFVAFRIPNLFRRIVAEGAASTAFVPVFTSRLVRGGEAEAVNAAAAVGRASAVTLAILVVMGMLLSEPIVALFAPGFAADPAKQALTESLTALTFPYLAAVGMAAWAMGTLHTFRRFTAPALGPILLNLSIIASATLLAGRFEQPVYALVVGVLVGGTLQFVVQIPSLGAIGLRARALLTSSDAAVRRVGALLLPTVFGGAVYQINILVATMLASLLPGSSVSYLWYADRVFEFPLGIIAVAVGTAALPSLSSQASGGRLGEMAESVGYSLRLVWSLCIPATVGVWLLAPDIVAVLFGRGAFGPDDVAMTAWALRAYSFGLLGVASVRVLVSVFYAFETPRIPVAAACAALVVNALADLALMGPTDPAAPWWGAAAIAAAGDALRIADLRHAGLAAGTGIAATVNAALLFVLARRRLPALAAAGLVRSFALHALAAGAMGAAVVGWASLTGSTSAAASANASWWVVGGAVPIGGLVYLATAAALGSAEVRGVLAALLRRGQS